MKFGRNHDTSPNPHPMFGCYLNASTLPTPPPSCDYGASGVGAPGTGLEDDDGNSLLGNCEAARYAHQLNVWTGNTGSLFLPTLQQVIDFYKIISGYDGTPATDRGAGDLVTITMAKEIGLGGHKIAAAVTVDAHDRFHVASSIQLLGGIWFSINLPNPWLTNVQPGAIWDLAGPPNPAQGHAILGVAYDKDYVDVITWGRRVRMTWQAVAAYATSEAGGAAFGAVSQDWIGAKGTPAQGFDLQALLAEAPQIGGAV